MEDFDHDAYAFRLMTKTRACIEQDHPGLQDEVAILDWGRTNAQDLMKIYDEAMATVDSFHVDGVWHGNPAPFREAILALGRCTMALCDRYAEWMIGTGREPEPIDHPVEPTGPEQGRLL